MLTEYEIVYGVDPESILEVLEIQLLSGRTMRLTFSNGDVRLFDASILTGEVFEPLKEDRIFSGAVVDRGVVTWADGTIDCAPEFMYCHSVHYKPPLSDE